MKHTLITLFFLISFITTGISQFNFGAGAQLVFDGGVFGLQGKALYEINDTWRSAGTFTFHLDNFYNWTIDLDAQYKLLEVSDNFDLAPIAGLSIVNADIIDTEIGINLGAFIDFVPSDSYHIYVEPKLVVGNLSSLVISGGILF